jgi:hypothetical protein
MEEWIRLRLWNLLGCPQGDVRVAWIDQTNGDLCMTAYDNPNAALRDAEGVPSNGVVGGKVDP